MNRDQQHNRSLFEPPQTWRHLPESIRQQALEVLTTLCLQAVSEFSSPSSQEPYDHEPSND